MSRSIGAIEFRSISKGIEVSNEMVKKAFIEVLYFKSICPGKFLIIVAGDVSEVKVAIEYGVNLCQGYIVDSFIINAIHEDIIRALKNRYTSREIKAAIGIMETSKVCSGMIALDKTLKTSSATLVKLQLAFGIGGKLVYIVSGQLSDVEMGIYEGKKLLNKKEIINYSIIPSLHSEIIKNLF